MTKIDIIQDVYEKLGFSKKDSARIVESVFDIIKDNLTTGEKIKISGFGNFVVKEKKARRGETPRPEDDRHLGAKGADLQVQPGPSEGAERLIRSGPHS